MSTRITVTKTLRCTPSELTVATLRTFLDSEDPRAKVNVKTDHPDRPGELSQVTITLVSEVDS